MRAAEALKIRGLVDFGSGADVDLCDWNNVPFSAFEWLPSNGKDSYWIGGPRKDSNANNELGEWAGRGGCWICCTLDGISKSCVFPRRGRLRRVHATFLNPF